MEEGKNCQLQKVKEAQKQGTGVGSENKDVEKEVCFDVTHSKDDITCSYVEGVLCSDEIGKSNAATGNMVRPKGGVITELFDLNSPPPDHDILGHSATPGVEEKVMREKRIDSSSSGIGTTLRRSSRRLARGGGGSFVGIVKNVQKVVFGGFEGVAPSGDVDGKDLMEIEGNSGSSLRKRKRRKRMELLDNGSSVTETLYTSTSLLASALSADNETHSLKKTFTNTGYQQLKESSVFSPKLKLPPSSGKLDLDGIPVLDLFSVYTCLRSFSTFLFLSPFGLEDLVTALKRNSANTLFDCIHVTLLQTLRKQMVLVSDESKSASICLRNLNWDLLDSITWPSFMVDYMLIHGSTPKSDLDLPKLKLFEGEYYKQTAVVKIEMLRCLCDDIIEVDAIRSELNRRMLATEPDIDIDRNLKTEISKRRRTSTDVLGGSFLTEEVTDETADWNSDECCLCKMDGSLICCDGCPAAYHMKCVGVSNNSLPEGDWYCPECLIDKDKPWLKMGRSLRGAEIQGVDPYGRVYYISAGYLLVLDSCDEESSCHYYPINDLTAVIEALKSSGPFYQPLLDSISKHLDIYSTSIQSKSKTAHAELMEEQILITYMLQQHVAPSESCSMDVTFDNKKFDENLVVAQYSNSTECDDLAKSVKMESISGASVETSQALGNNNVTLDGPVVITKCVKNIVGDIGNNIQGQSRVGYVNCYIFARTSSMVFEELTMRSVDKITGSSTKPYEDIIFSQQKAIIKTSSKFVWPIIQNLGADTRKEKCGWCFACRAQDTDDGFRDCLFNLNVSTPLDFDNETVGLLLKNGMEGHFVDVLCYILYMEDRLRGLLLGPWLNPHYTKLWRDSIIKASDVASLKHFLLMLEANLNRRALTPDWIIHVDSVTTMGSASHIVTSSSRLSSKHVVGGKRARCPDLEPKPSLNAARGLGILWWRGGKLSRELFNWKVLPRALASKAARQAGCTKVEGVLYPDSSDFTKRSKSVVWKAAVEASKSVGQLALQVRELDANIRWDDIENTHFLPKIDQCKKIVKSFKKVIIRKKLIEGTVVKYLLDCGKKRFIPDVVVNHGSIVEESSGRKKYWLEETFVPLHLLKPFEERRISRKRNMNPGKSHCSELLTKRTSKRKGLPYLFEKAERPKYYQCGHCQKDVLIREALCCVSCKGFFHKRHVKRSPGAKGAECTYSCHKCQSGNFENSETRKGKKLLLYKSKNSLVGSRELRTKTKKKVYKNVKPIQKRKNDKKDSVVLPLRRSPRKLKCVALKNKKVGKQKKRKGKGKQITCTRKAVKQSMKSTWQKKRTQVYNAYWLNGIRFSRKPHDERVQLFKGKSIVTPSSLQLVSMVSPPKCSLSCEKVFTPSLSYVSCDICKDWFHGDAFGLAIEKMDSIIGFRCHECRAKISPICPHSHKETKEEFGEVNTCDGDKELKDSFLGSQYNHEDQEIENASFPISISTSGQSSVENI